MAFDNTESCTQWWKSRLAEVMTLKKVRYSHHSVTEGATDICPPSFTQTTFLLRIIQINHLSCILVMDSGIDILWIDQSVDIVVFEDGRREAFITCLQEQGLYNALI